MEWCLLFLVNESTPHTPIQMNSNTLLPYRLLVYNQYYYATKSLNSLGGFVTNQDMVESLRKSFITLLSTLHREATMFEVQCYVAMGVWIRWTGVEWNGLDWTGLDRS